MVARCRTGTDGAVLSGVDRACCWSGSSFLDAQVAAEASAVFGPKGDKAATRSAADGMAYTLSGESGGGSGLLQARMQLPLSPRAPAMQSCLGWCADFLRCCLVVSCVPPNSAEGGAAPLQRGACRHTLPQGGRRDGGPGAACRRHGRLPPTGVFSAGLAGCCVCSSPTAAACHQRVQS